jgi:hypothetical protein
VPTVLVPAPETGRTNRALEARLGSVAVVANVSTEHRIPEEGFSTHAAQVAAILCPGV